MTNAILTQWTYPGTDETMFLLERSTDSGSTWPLKWAFPHTASSYIDVAVAWYGTYWYKVAAAPVVTPDITIYGDSHDLTQSFGDPSVGIDKTLTITGGSIISSSGNTYIPVSTATNTGSITGPSTSSIDTGSYVLIPPNTDLIHEVGWFLNIHGASSGSNGLMMVYQVGGITMALTSSNGVNWTGAGTASYPPIAVSYANGRYIGLNCPGNNSDAQYSDDGGATWTLTTIPTSNYIWDVIYDGTQFVGCGNNGTIITSSNGIDWGLSSTGVSDCAFRIAYNGLRYVVVGPTSNGAPGGTGLILTSTDLMTWESVSASATPVSTAYQGVAYSPSLGKFLAVGEVGMMASSPDGVNWTDISQPAPIFGTDMSCVEWNPDGGHFAACEYGGYIYTSPDGLSWALNTINPHVQFEGNYYTYVQRLAYESSINKFLVFGLAPPT